MEPAPSRPVLSHFCNEHTDLGRSVRRFASPGKEIVISFCNYSFLDLAFNWLHNVLKMGISNYLLVALDPRAHEVLTQKEVQTCMLPKEDEVLWGEDSENFGTVGFKAICNEKPFLVLEIVKDGWDVLWTDVDIVWLSNPFPYFTDVDFTVQQDDDGLCAGFFLLRSTPAGLAWMQRVVDYLNPFIDDQISMRRNIADEKRMTWQYLPRTLFPNGSAYFDLKIPQRKNITPVIIHNNCIIGHRSKVERFQAYGLWFLGPEPPKPSLPTTISPAAVLRSHNEAVTCLTFWQGSLYSASYDKSLRTWNPSNGTLVSTAFPNKRGGVWDIKFVTEEGKVRELEQLISADHPLDSLARQAGTELVLARALASQELRRTFGLCQLSCSDLGLGSGRRG